MSTFAGPFNLFGLIERSFGFYLPVSISAIMLQQIYLLVLEVLFLIFLYLDLYCNFFCWHLFST